MTSSQAEEVVEEQAQIFEDRKDYLIRLWDQGSKEGKTLKDNLPGTILYGRRMRRLFNSAVILKWR
jgi:hypothetical protein